MLWFDKQFFFLFFTKASLVQVDFSHLINAEYSPGAC